jgi:hypothetical protein
LNKNKNNYDDQFKINKILKDEIKKKTNLKGRFQKGKKFEKLEKKFKVLCCSYK